MLLVCKFVTSYREEIFRTELQKVFSVIHLLRLQLVQNAPDDGRMSSETCRANISAE